MVWDGGHGGKRARDLEQLTEGAALLSRAGNRVAALAVLWAAVAIAPTDQVAHRRLAATLANAGDLEGAAQEYVRYIEFLLPLGELTRVTAELHYAASSLGARPALVETTRHVAAQLPDLIARRRDPVAAAAGVATVPAVDEQSATPAPGTRPDPSADQTLVRFPSGRAFVRVPFRVCLHEDADSDWIQLEGGTAHLGPSNVRLIADEVVIETRRCLAMPPGRPSHAGPVGTDPGAVWIAIAVPPEMLRAIERGEGDRYRVEAQVGDEWFDTDLTDTGCRSGSSSSRTTADLADRTA